MSNDWWEVKVVENGYSESAITALNGANGGLELVLRLWSELCCNGLQVRRGRVRVRVVEVRVTGRVKVGFRD